VKSSIFGEERKKKKLRVCQGGGKEGGDPKKKRKEIHFPPVNRKKEKGGEGGGRSRTPRFLKGKKRVLKRSWNLNCSCIRTEGKEGEKGTVPYTIDWGKEKRNAEGGNECLILNGGKRGKEKKKASRTALVGGGRGEEGKGSPLF